MKAIALQSISGISVIKDLESSTELLAEVKGTLLKEKISIFPGDYVEYTNNNSTCIITKLFPRTNFLIRPRIANIDILVIIQSFKEPNMNITMLNKYILFFQSQKIDNIVLFFTKYDILNFKEKEESDKIIQHFKNDNFLTFVSNDINSFIDFLNKKSNKVICFTGQSGVGKSTLLNKINNEYNIKTNEISKALNRGKHTTTSTNLLPYKNGYLADTPGFSSINLEMDKISLATGYTDFRNYSLKCKFNNCLHKTEPSCKVKEKVKEKVISERRYNDYLIFLESLNFKK